MCLKSKRSESYTYEDETVKNVWKPDACKQDDADSVCCSLVIWETFATLNYLAPPYSCALIHRNMQRLARSLFPSVSLPFVFFFFFQIFRALFSLAVTAAFLSPVSCLFPETNTSSSSLMKAVFCIENGLAQKKQKNKKQEIT